jgi:class 3 adenylate cyclase/tetratricopeptide (TPR) repeat protein
MVLCPNCGRENPEGARFCNSCASPLRAESAPAREERKVVTVLFADLVGFTSRSEQLDPEDVRATLSPYYTRLRSELERFGGTVEKFIGDAVMALFGAPIAHEDDPERAVRAALAIRDWVTQEQADLQVRIAVATGEALVTIVARPSEGEGMAAGDVVNTAARLQSAAPVNGILVGEGTYRATRQAIEYRDAEPVEAKGKSEPIPVWEALNPRARFGAETGPSEAPLVGRAREVDLLRDALARTREERSPQLLTLVGAPGLGKTRLVAELYRIVEAEPEITWWRRGRSLPYGEGVAFWAFAEMVKAHAGILESDTSEEAASKLRAAVGDAVSEDAEWVEHHLRPLVGLSGRDTADVESQGESFAAWRRFVEALAERRPAVLVFEDLHWADDNLLDFVDHLADWATGVPILILCTARPELLERRPGWGGGKRNAQTLSLSALSDEDTARLLAALLDQPVLAADTQAALLARAGGNPLYAEQYARMLAERPDHDEGELPETVQGIIAARLDSLPLAEKELLLNAAVLGKVFWLGALEAFGGVKRPDAEQLLHALERKEFVRRERRASVAGEVEYGFAHLLVRDVAYGQIPRAQRVEKHRLAAEWIESLAADRSEDRADMLAHHYVAALELAEAAGVGTEALSGPARRALREAGDRAFALAALPTAVRLYSQALELWPIEDPDQPELVLRREEAVYRAGQNADVEALATAIERLLEAGEIERAVEGELVTAISWWWMGRREKADAHADRALALVRDAPPSPAKAWTLVERARLFMLAQEADEALEVGQEGLELAQELGLQLLEASALITIGVTRGIQSGDAAGGIADLERGLELALRLKAPQQVQRGYNNVAEVKIESGQFEEVAALYKAARRFSEEFGLSGSLRWISFQEASFFFFTGEWERAERLLNEFLAEVESGSPHYGESSARPTRAQLRYARGATSGALSDATRGLEAARESKDPQSLGPALAVLGTLLVAEGRAPAARPLLDELLGLTNASGGFLYYAWLVELGWLAHDLGRGDEYLQIAAREQHRTPWLEAGSAIAAGDFSRAVEVLASVGLWTYEAYARLRAAEQLVQQGRRIEADEQLRSALAFYREVGATAYLRRGEDLLAASA